MTIVVGYDGTDYSMQALDWAMDEAEHRHAPLLVAHAWHWPYEPGDDLGRDSLRRAAEHVLWHGAECARNCTSGLTVDSDLREGPAAEHLIELSRVADLVVVGSRGRRALVRTMIGSVADRVVTHAHSPVIVVRGAGSVPRRPDPGPIVAAVAGHDHPADDHVLEFAYREASMRGLPLVAAQAWQYPVAWSPGTSLFLPDSLGEEVLGPITEAWRTKYPEVESTHLLEEGPVPDVLTRLSATATLLVVGAARSPGPLGRIGSVTRPVLHRATCPIAVVR
ncbi:universal stress protein [Acrocarpospora pleiomorpha]|uniref:Universal stress protein n=1 Tax=Acrocarpospora pleiomorpha TaxID=90975 RepID=A0A5M3XHE0_9ACTN|nr:universal stress protein [Acrocarpospora pleiomorpha]GES18423.1 universal stress protein [Acrocarpospora pleiomorpha]